MRTPSLTFRPAPWPLVLAVMSLTTACVTTGTYDRKINELDGLLEQHDRMAAARENELNARIKSLEAQSREDSQRIAALTAERDGLRKQLDDTIALSGELKKRLEKLGQNVDKLASEKGQLAQVLADAKARLEDLRR